MSIYTAYSRPAAYISNTCN